MELLTWKDVAYLTDEFIAQELFGKTYDAYDSNSKIRKITMSNYRDQVLVHCSFRRSAKCYLTPTRELEHRTLLSRWHASILTNNVEYYAVVL